MKKSEIPLLKEKILDLLPTLQCDIWINNTIPELKDRRNLSKVVLILETENAIKRTKFFDKERKITTFKIERLNGNTQNIKKPNKKSPNNKNNTDKKINNIKKTNKPKNDKNKFLALLGKDNKFSPCCGCNEADCRPQDCKKIIEWMI